MLTHSSGGFVAHLREYVRWRMRNAVHRSEIINYAARHLRATRYLEIGVREGKTFCRIDVANKVGVDPVPPAPPVVQEMDVGRARYFRMTSDEFFERHVAGSGGSFDVVLIDGLHTYKQALRDCENAVRYLSTWGAVFVHDCSPSTAARAHPAASLEEIRRAPPMGWDGYWNGDVWKAIVHLRSQRADLRICVLDTDHGVGVIVRRPAAELLPYTPAEVAQMTYDDLAADRSRLLGLRRPAYLFEVIVSLTEQGA